MSTNWRDLVIERIEASRKFANNDPTIPDTSLGVLDPRDTFGQAPEYPKGMLPKLFENFFEHKIAGWGGDPASYAVAFAAMHCATLDASVKMAPNPLMPDDWRNPNDFALIVGKSGQKKSGVWRDVTSHVNAFQTALMANVKTRRFPMAFLQQCSVEGMMKQLQDNNGMRLCVGSEEVMDFYAGSGAHRGDGGIAAMSNAVCIAYDGGAYSKKLVKDSVIVPVALATIIGVTVDTNIMQWREFNTVVKSGLMARHSVGVISRMGKPDPDQVNPAAEKAMNEFMVLMRGLSDMRLSLADDAKPAWLAYREQREQLNDEMTENKDFEGLIAYCRKYELRVMTLATIFQLYDFVAAGKQAKFKPMQVAASEAEADKVGATKTIKLVDITRDNLNRAVEFFENFLIPTQRHFYKAAQGATEFGVELTNFAAYHLTNDDPKNPGYRDLNRGDLTFRGPTSMRGAVTVERKEVHKRWIQALLDHGFIEPYEHPKQRAMKKAKEENELPWYRVRLEFYEFFKNDLSWFRDVDTKMKARMLRNGIGDSTIRLSLPKD